jgi:hypothetical protein
MDQKGLKDCQIYVDQENEPFFTNIYIYEVRVTHKLYQCRQMGKKYHEICKDLRQKMP